MAASPNRGLQGSKRPLHSTVDVCLSIVHKTSNPEHGRRASNTERPIKESAGEGNRTRAFSPLLSASAHALCVGNLDSF